MEQKPSSKYGNEKGSAVVAAIVGVFIFSLIAVAVLALSTSQMTITAHDKQSLIAFNVADAGVSRAIWQLNKSSSYTGETGGVGQGEYSVVVTGTGNSRTITSTGHYPSIANSKIKRKIVALAELRPPHAFDFALTGGAGLKLEGGPLSIAGNVHSNSNINAEGNVTVDGAGSAVGTINTEGSVTFTQGQQTGAASVVFPSIDRTSLYNQASANGVTTGDVIIGGTTVTTVTGLIEGNLQIKNNAQVTFSGVVYVEGEIRIKDSATVTGNNVAGADGKIKFEDNVTVTSSAGGTLTFISFRSGEEAIQAEGNANISAILYAPNGEVKLEDRVQILGSVVGNTVEAEGNLTITHNDALSPPPSAFSDSFMITSWREVAP